MANAREKSCLRVTARAAEVAAAIFAGCLAVARPVQRAERSGFYLAGSRRD